MPRGFGVVLPVFVDHAEGAVLVDVDGNRLIDMASGIAVTSVGAAVPEVAEALNRLTPGEHAKRSALFTTGAEAVENAVKIARVHTGRPAVVVLGHAYHGRTLMTMTMTAKNVPYKEGFGPFAPRCTARPRLTPTAGRVVRTERAHRARGRGEHTRRRGRSLAPTDTGYAARSSSAVGPLPSARTPNPPPPPLGEHTTGTRALER